uniref:Uncharacterized protein n=1 Tax=Hemiselmis andersenii TaxID=464988 RepID=A0A7S1DIP2_HEMAN
MWGRDGKGGRCQAWEDIDRSNGTHRINFRGRMSNGIIEYLYTRIAADTAGVGIAAIGNGLDNLKLFYPNIEYKEGGERKVIPANKKCGPHFQSYAFFRTERCLAQCILAPTPTLLTPFMFKLKAEDVMIHFRRPFFQFKGKNPHGIRRHTAWHTTPTYEYFANILESIKRKGILGRVYLVAEPHQRDDDIVVKLEEVWNATWVSGSPNQDHYLSRVSPTFIGSFGTFTWTIVYLSQAKTIHLPIVSNMTYGSTWNWWEELFIEDDPRITYHDEVLPDWGGIGGFLTAADVIASNTVYSRSILNRTDGEFCHPRRDKVLAYGSKDKKYPYQDLYTGELLHPS